MTAPEAPVTMSFTALKDPRTKQMVSARVAIQRV